MNVLGMLFALAAKHNFKEGEVPTNVVSKERIPGVYEVRVSAKKFRGGRQTVEIELKPENFHDNYYPELNNVVEKFRGH